MTTLTEMVAEHRFTKGLNPRYLHLLTECASLEHFAAQQMIFEEGGPADRFYLIHTGLVALQTFVPGHGVTTIQTLGTGEALGWSWLVPPYRWHFSAVAVEPVEAVSICAPMMKDRMEENHDFGYAILLQMGPVMLERLQSTRMRLLEAYGMPA
jgi:CRP/FNR family transcriptional regulator, cyclic AMP receptor protein